MRLGIILKIFFDSVLFDLYHYRAKGEMKFYTFKTLLKVRWFYLQIRFWRWVQIKRIRYAYRYCEERKD